MSRAIRKCAASNDPRDWTFLNNFQRWGTFMPAWNYSMLAPLNPAFPGAPFFDEPVVFEKQVDGLNGNAIRWEQTVTIDVPDLGPVPAIYFAMDLTCFPPEAPLTGTPIGDATLTLGGIFLQLLTFALPSFCYFDGFFFNPTYDQELVGTISGSIPGLLADFKPFFVMTPVKFDTPTF